MAVAFMMFIKELRKNGGEIAASAENNHLPPIFFFPFLAELDIFILAFDTCNISNILLFNQKIISVQCKCFEKK